MTNLGAASRLLAVGLPLITILTLWCSPIDGQMPQRSGQIGLQNEFDNGHFAVVVEKIAVLSDPLQVRPGTKVSAEILLLYAKALISSQRYEEALKSLDQALVSIEGRAGGQTKQSAEIHFAYSMLYRAKRDFGRALESAQEALSVSPNDRQIRCEYYLSVGKILFSFGFDLSAAVWMEKAEKLVDAGTDPSIRFEIYRFLSLAWESKFRYAKAESYGEKLVSMAEKTRFQYRYRVGLLDLANLKSASGQKRDAMAMLEKGAKLSIAAADRNLALSFLSRLMFNSLYNGNIDVAESYLGRLEQVDLEKSYLFETTLGRAIIAAFQGRRELSDNHFAEAAKVKHYSNQLISYWKSTIALRNRNWEHLLNQTTELRKLVEEENFREDLPGIYLNFARALFGLGRISEGIEYAHKSIALVDEMRPTGEASLSLGLTETYQDANRLLAELRVGEPEISFAFADYVKGRVLRDRIDNSILRPTGDIPSAQQAEIERLVERFVESNGGDKDLGSEIERLERSITANIPPVNSGLPNLQDLNSVNSLGDSAIVSYLFTVDGKLLAYIWERDKPVRVVPLSPTEGEVGRLAVDTQRKINNLLYFKKDAKEIYDKLLRPLSLKTNHLIIIPDKALWKVPFHALSPDGEKYLIETTAISYAPSVSILLEQLKSPKLTRKSMQAFASPSYKNEVLRYVNAEANGVSELYDSKPLLNATDKDFERISDKFDILHFSMHAQVSNDQPLDSFLAFKPVGKNDGRLTVEDILKIKLKKGSLVFLASCDTNNVLNGEGLVSLAWAMMGSGATTVISAQWEANDKSTEIFTRTFYAFYKAGNSSAAALQKASLEMIKNKSRNMHEPYYWADFTVNGDYR